MELEVKKCQSCKADFPIEPEDFDFYTKIQVPPPTHCPSCRLQRRLAWFKGLRLYKRKCDLCHEEKVSMYRPEAPYTVYCAECWWSDKWDPMEYGIKYDSSRPFFEQFNEQMHRVPIRGLAVTKEITETSPFTNHCDHAKNCYLIFYSDYDEDCQYGFFLARDKSLLDCSVLWECEYCYDSMNGFRNNRVHGSRGNVHNSIDCHFIKDSRNAQDSFGSSNLYNKKYVFFNEQLTKEEYEKRRGEIDLGSYKTYEEMKEKAMAVWRNSIPCSYYDYFSENSTGNYVFYSKNCKECYDSGYCENCKFMMLIKNPSVKDSYDYTDWGEGAELIYECITVGNAVSNVRFSQDVHASHHVEYSKSCMSGANLFGCSALRGKEYCVLNTQYSKEEYQKLTAEIIEDMKRRGEYGEFFPMTTPPHEYNDTFAHMFFPLEKEVALKQGLSWAENAASDYQITKKYEELPDHIKDVGDDILKEIIQCKTCSRGYRITNQELQFLRQHNFPLPRRCPFCRIEEKIKQWVKQMTLHSRTCDKCQAEFRTPYTKEDAPKIYCKKCYWAEFM